MNLVPAFLFEFNFSDLVFLTGLSQLANIPAMIMAPKMLGWKEDLGKLQPINRNIFMVLGIGMSLIIVSSGVVVMVGRDEMLNGSLLGVSFACFLALVWTYRGLIQIFLYTRIWPGGRIGKVSHLGLSVLFVFQALVYWICFFTGMVKRN